MRPSRCWPAGLPGFREPLEAYIEAMHVLAERVMGLLAELIVRTYYETQNKTVYHVQEILRLPETPGHD